MNFVLSVLIILIVTTVGEAQGAANPPVKVNDLRFDQNKSSNQVLIYYANETAPDDQELVNFNVIKSWLKESNTEIGRKQIRRYDIELSKFIAVVDSEIEQLKSQLVLNKSSDLPSVVLVTNRLARAKTIEVYDAKSGHWQMEPIDISASDNYIENSNPLVTTNGLRAVLSKAAELFDPKQFQFLLHIKSHGTRNQALTTMLGRRHEELVKQEVIDAVKKAQSDLDLGIPTNVVAESNIGIPKATFFSVLQELGQSTGMSFPILYLEACKSGLKLDAIDSMGSNIGIIFSSDHEGIAYSNIKYNEIDLKYSSIAMNYLVQLSALSKEALVAKYNFDSSPFFAKPATNNRSIYVWSLVVIGITLLIVPWPKKRLKTA